MVAASVSVIFASQSEVRNTHTLTLWSENLKERDYLRDNGLDGRTK
jgi:hypothetical protein